MASNILKQVWEKQKLWSLSADRLKRQLGIARRTSFVLGIAGAFTETLATQIPSGIWQQVLAWTGAACLAVIPLILKYKLGDKQTHAWIRARSASEALKSETYKYCTQAAPYDDPETAPGRLQVEYQNIMASVEDLMAVTAFVTPGAGESTAPGRLPPQDYIAERIRQQVDWYNRKARIYARQVAGFRRLEFILALAAALLATAAGIWTNAPGFHGVPLSIGAWVAVLTTIGAAVTTHITASRYDFLVSSYFATANRLENLAVQWPDWPDQDVVPSEKWSEFVHQCEHAISTENQGWMTKWTQKA